MTSISTQSYATGYSAAASAAPTASGQAQASKTDTADAGAGSSVTVTLSEAAKAALKAQADTPSLDDVTAAARTAIDKLLTTAGATDAVVGGKATIDLSGLDRRSLFAVADNASDDFTPDEHALASDTMAANFENALAGPVAASRVTGDYASIYKAALSYLDKAGPEEKASSEWTQERAAVAKGFQAATAKPGVLPTGDDDPVAAYVTALNGADPTPTRRDIIDVAGDVRTALDAQYADATSPGAAASPNTGAVDLSKLDDRSLAAIALNKGDQFSAHEILAAKTEIRARSASSMTSSYSQSSGTNAFSSDLISRYTSMSDEERQAQGWTPELFASLVQNYKLSQSLAGLAGGSSASGLLGVSDPSSSTSTSSSLLDFLT